ncbi:response regulator [Cyclobacterium amurskyense]|uniref:Receiver protein of a two-component response regulator n=1 Tax=Cyclobacterium amurskyense TaxID=320787 RepID=A0A0H4PAF1_9BACT|nr:response regulator [Cyclobacterium amurskyense]AKP49723.1 Receiver protein of a two-component response regulator [Cyclobacterium amurskyense]
MKQKKHTIVFVDDDKVQHMINKRVLQKMNLGVNMVFFVKPFEALEWLGTNNADVILLDINMPEIDGWEFLKRMEAEGINGNVKMLTASLDPGDVIKSEEFKQISGFLVKPLKEENYIELLAD